MFFRLVASKALRISRSFAMRRYLFVTPPGNRGYGMPYGPRRRIDWFSSNRRILQSASNEPERHEAIKERHVVNDESAPTCVSTPLPTRSVTVTSHARTRLCSTETVSVTSTLRIDASHFIRANRWLCLNRDSMEQYESSIALDQCLSALSLG